jgi:tungstate transport system ATP-binding protein
MALIEAVSLGKEFAGGQYALKEVDLRIDRRDVVAVIGPTGSGKTTLLRLLDLLDSPTSGRMLFDGVDVAGSGHQRLAVRRRMSFVQQKPIVFSMNVNDNVACGLRWRRERKETVRQRVESSLELVGMADYGTRDAKTLSGGETQRVAIARALVTDPEVLLLDEPTANLDPVSVARIEDVLERIIGEGKITIVMATHDMSQGQRLASKIGVLMNGRMLQVGSPGDVFCSPTSREVAEFVGVDNILAGVIAERDGELAVVDVRGHQIQAVSDYPLGEPVNALIRPEDITFTHSRQTSSARNVLEGKVSRMTPVGPLTRVEVDCGFPLLGVLTTNSAQELELAVGSSVYASFKVTAIHVIKRRT